MACSEKKHQSFNVNIIHDTPIKSSSEGNGKSVDQIWLQIVSSRIKPMTISTNEKININSIQPFPENYCPANQALIGLNP